LIALGEGQLTKSQALAQATTATRQFAKRQVTWFRQRMREYVWIDPNKSNYIALLRQNDA
jgi:tRNA dimethylallyltransferase